MIEDEKRLNGGTKIRYTMTYERVCLNLRSIVSSSITTTILIVLA